MKMLVLQKLVLLALLFVPNVPAENGVKIPAVEGESNWGTVAQRGSTVILTGHPQWEAIGHFRKDRTLFLDWTHKSDERPQAISVYELKEDGRLVGLWGWDHEVSLDTEGNLVGDGRVDVIYFLRNR